MNITWNVFPVFTTPIDREKTNWKWQIRYTQMDFHYIALDNRKAMVIVQFVASNWNVQKVHNSYAYELCATVRQFVCRCTENPSQYVLAWFLVHFSLRSVAQKHRIDSTRNQCRSVWKHTKNFFAQHLCSVIC